MRLPIPNRLVTVSLALAALTAMASGFAGVLRAQQKSVEEREAERAQRQAPELPAAVIGETRRLTFHVAPLSGRGLLSQQLRDGLKRLRTQAGGASILHIRAFVAGAGDLRRVREVVSEVFTSEKDPLPSLTVVRAGALPLDGAQVALEAVASSRNEVNPNGVAFFSAAPAIAGYANDRLSSLTANALGNLASAFSRAGVPASNALRVSCYFSSLEDYQNARVQIAAAFPHAGFSLVQTLRAPWEAFAACEAVARLPKSPVSNLELVNSAPEPEGGVSAAALVSSRRVVLTGVQLALGYGNDDAHTAIARIRITLERAGADWKNVVLARFYPVSAGLAARVQKLRAEVFGEKGPAGELLVWEGLTSPDAGFGVDVVAARD